MYFNFMDFNNDCLKNHNYYVYFIDNIKFYTGSAGLYFQNEF